MPILVFYRESVLEYNHPNCLALLVITTSGVYVAFHMYSFVINVKFAYLNIVSNLIKFCNFFKPYKTSRIAVVNFGYTVIYCLHNRICSALFYERDYYFAGTYCLYVQRRLLVYIIALLLRNLFQLFAHFYIPLPQTIFWEDVQ